MKRGVAINKAVPNVGAMDFSYLLDAPAGKHGFVQARQGHLYFEDGTRAKFIGFNFPARANMPDHKTAERISRRLATMGVNVVRLHAVDVPPGERGWSANPEFPLIDYPSGSSRQLNSAGLERLDYWVSCLEEKGIYLHVDLLVARAFMEGDDLDYPSHLAATKSSSHLNETLIRRQKEFATQYLCHVNPYTGKALIDDPAVMTIQITNEDSIFFDVKQRRQSPGVEFYKKEMQRRFNKYLLVKYGSREHLKEAWTWEGRCALRPEEDPETDSVRCMEVGDYYQPMNEPSGDWEAWDSPARYADFVEFGVQLNRNYYGRMIDHIRGLGAKVPIATSCLLTGAADIYSHMDGDVMENNAYFNHPAPRRDRQLYVPWLREYVTSDPRKETFPDLDHRSNLTVQASCAAVEGKPFVLSEWNEYGEYPFHSSAFMMTAAYACLNDWDGLILYCYHTCDESDSPTEDVIEDIMDAYNDPSLIYPFGVMASVFLKGCVKPARNRFHLVYTQNDLLTQPTAHRMPHSILPFIGSLRTVFLEHGNRYEGDAEAAVSAGFVSGADLTGAKHAALYEHVPYLDAFRRSKNAWSLEERYPDVYESGRSCSGAAEGDVLLGGKYLLFKDLAALTKDGDYSAFAACFDRAAKRWGLLGPDQGITDRGAIVSDTGELVFHPGEGYFRMNTEQCVFFSGHVNRESEHPAEAHPAETFRGKEGITEECLTEAWSSAEGMPEKPAGLPLGGRFFATCRNEKITLALLSLDGRAVDASSHLLFTAIGSSGMSGTVYEKQEDEHTAVKLQGKLYVETFEGTLDVAGCRRQPVLWVLDSYGNRVRQILPEKISPAGGEKDAAFRTAEAVEKKPVCPGNYRFCLDGCEAWGNYELEL